MEEFFINNVLNWVVLPIFCWIFLWIWLTAILPELKKTTSSFLLKNRKFILKNLKIDITSLETLSYVEWHRNSKAPIIFKVLIIYIIGVSLGFLWEIGFEATKKLAELEIGQFADVINVFVLF
tara:strand:- start:116 stop:484 length:369 start_codon:yes stop_codon:yes gene_type:complete